MIFLSAFLLAILLPVLSFGPGFFFVRRLRWINSEKICASIGLSILLIYFVATAIYLLHLNWRYCWLASGGGLLLTLFSWRDLVRLWTKRNVRRQFGGFGLLLAAGFLMLCLIQHYSGGEWAGDWLEHYHRTGFFLKYQPYDTIFIQKYVLPARPPMMNLITAHFLAHVGERFDLFQIVSLFLNLLVLFPCILLANHLVKNGGRRVWLIAAFLTLNPVVMENATWAWTKLLAAFFVILSLAFYLRAWRKNDPIRMIVAAASMAAAILVHYSAGPYAIALLLHYLCILPWRQNKLIEIGGSVVTGTLLLASWFVWSLAIYGPKTTFASNTTATEMQHASASQNALKIGGNFRDTLLPHPVMMNRRIFNIRFDQPNPFGFVRDFFFLIYQTTLTFAWGLFAWIPLTWVMLRQLSNAAGSIRFFWISFTLISIGLGIAVHGSREEFGVAHVCLQPIILIGLTLLATGLVSLPLWTRYVTAGFMVIDVVLGILLQCRMEMQRIYLVRHLGADILPLSDSLLSPTAIQNSTGRISLNMVYWADHFAMIAASTFVAFAVVLGIALFVCLITSGTAKIRNPFGIAIFGFYCVGVFFLNCDGAMGSGYRQPPFSAAPTTLEPQLRAVAIMPDSSQPHYQLGLAYYHLGKVNESADALFQAFLLDPSNLQARYALNVLLLTHGQSLLTTQSAIPEGFLQNPRDVTRQLAMMQMLAAYKHELPALNRLRDTMLEHSDSDMVRTVISNMGTNLDAINRRIAELEGSGK